MIELIRQEGTLHESLVGLGTDLLCITDEMIDATFDSRRMFPHIVQGVAANIANAERLNRYQHLLTMRSLRDELRAAIDARNAFPTVIMDPINQEDILHEA